MTEETRIEDRHGRDIAVGDLVHFVYGGDHHEMKVEEVDGTVSPHLVRGTIRVTVHAASSTRHRRPEAAKASQKSNKSGEKGETA